MNICINLFYLKIFRSTDLLTYLALILAYIALVWSVNRDLKAWKSLFISFKNDLEAQAGWLQNEYFNGKYEEKESYSPSKIIYPLSFESLPEIIRRGVAELSGISEDFIKNLSIFNERILAFNSALDQVIQVCSTDPIKSEKLIDMLNEIGLDKHDVSFNEFKTKIYKLKKKEDLLYLAENIRRLHKVIHVALIGNKNKHDGLHFLFSEINIEVNNIISNFDKKRPMFIRYSWLYILLSLPIFILIEFSLK